MVYGAGGRGRGRSSEWWGEQEVTDWCVAAKLSLLAHQKACMTCRLMASKTTSGELRSLSSMTKKRW